MASPVPAATKIPISVPLARRGSSFLVLAPTESTVGLQRRDSSFLELVPASSDSFPQDAPGRYSVPGSAMITPLSNSSDDKPFSPVLRPVIAATSPVLEERPKTQRSNSVTSSSSGSSGADQRRFLKLGPVHFGGEAGVPDYCEE